MCKAVRLFCWSVGKQFAVSITMAGEKGTAAVGKYRVATKLNCFTLVPQKTTVGFLMPLRVWAGAGAASARPCRALIAARPKKPSTSSTSVELQLFLLLPLLRLLLLLLFLFLQRKLYANELNIRPNRRTLSHSPRASAILDPLLSQLHPLITLAGIQHLWQHTHSHRLEPLAEVESVIELSSAFLYLLNSKLIVALVSSWNHQR